MNCDKVQDLLSEAIDGTLPASLSRPFQDHMTSCPPCRLLFADVKDSLSLLADFPAIEVGAEFDDAVRARLRAEQRVVAPSGVAGHIARWRESFEGAAFWVRWAPLGAAAAVFLWVAVSHDTSVPGGVAENASADLAATSPASIMSQGAFAASAEPEANSNPELVPVEFTAPMPEAVEVFLESAQELRLNPDRYRRSNYHYPLRAVRDPQSVSMVPVSSGVVRSQAAPEESGTLVLTF